VGHKRAALSVELVNDRAFWREKEREARIRVAIGNSAKRARVGRAEDVSVSVKPPLAGYTVEPSLGFVSVILPWERNVTYDLVVQLPDDPEAGKIGVPLELTFTDLAEGRTSQHHKVEVELLDPEQVRDGATYDPLAALEIERLTGGRQQLRELIERAAVGTRSDSRVVYAEDLEEVVMELIASPQLRDRLGWTELTRHEKAVVRELCELQGAGVRAHVKGVEIQRSLLNSQEDQLVNWNRVIKDLVRKRVIEETDGLYRMCGELLRRWVVEQEVELSFA